MAATSSGVRPIVVPAPAVFSTIRRVGPGVDSIARVMARLMRAIAASRSPSVAAPGWKHTIPSPSVQPRSSSFARPALARSHLAASGVATFST
jgi:hypothetical protein